MKVWIENADTNPNVLKGKSLFCHRLAHCLRSRGVFVTDNPDTKADVSLNVIRIKHKNSKIKILRLDGVWHDTAKDFVQKNKTITDSLKRANGVIYQSNFSRQMCNRYLGEPKCRSAVIYNGSSPDYYEQISPVKFECSNPVMAFSKWRPHKRLRDIIHSFLLANLSDSKLLIAGDLERSGLNPKEAHELVAMPQIEYLGMIPQPVLAPLLKGCVASIHLCWFDACPNSVVEAICAGVPVVCNNVGGTHEIVGPSGGYVCNVDSPYDLNPVDLYKPPKIDRQIVAAALRRCVKEKPKITNSHVHIQNTANMYLNFMRSLL